MTAPPPALDRAARAATLPDLAGADVTDWDRLARDDFYSATPWLRFAATDPDVTAGYTVLRDGGTIVAGVPLAAVHRENNSLYDWDTLAVARGVAPRTGGRLLVGPHRGYHTTLLAADPAAVAGPLARAVLEHATRLGLAGAVAAYLDTAGAVALRRSHPGALVLHLADDATIALPGAEFGDWLDGLGRHRRNRVRREIAAFAAAGYTVTRHLLAGITDLAGPLLGQVQGRYGHPADGAALARSQAAQAAAMGDAARALLLHRDGRTVGFVSYYHHGDTLYLRAAGFDYPRLVGAAEYFNLVYYEPIRLCYALGARHLHAGIEASRAKALRGAVLRPRWLVDLTGRPADPADLAATAEYNARAYAQLTADVPARAVDPADWTPVTGPDTGA